MKEKNCEELQREVERLKSLLDISLKFGSTLDLQEILNLIMEIAKKTLDAEASSIFQIDEEKRELFFVVATGEKGKEAKTIRIPWGKGIAGWVAEHGKPLLVPDVSKDPRFFQDVDKKTGFKTKSILAVPLIRKGKVIGVAEVINKKGGGEFTVEDTILFEAIAEQAAVAMENAKLYSQLENLFLSSIRAIVNAIEEKDEYTRGHTGRVTEYSLLIGKRLGLSNDEIKTLELSALLHDVGKIGIPDSILRKPGRLTDEEYAVIKSHPLRGVKILEPIENIRHILPGIRHHHERYDGKGYPDGLKGKKIPFYARIIAVADAFDAMTSDRPYRKGLPIEIARKEIEENRGTQFDPECADAFLRELDENPERIEEIIKRGRE